MELPSKILEQIAHITRPKIEEHLLIVMDKSTHEEHLFQPVQTKKRQFKIAIIFYLPITEFLILQTKILNFTSQNQLVMKMVIFK